MLLKVYTRQLLLLISIYMKAPTSRYRVLTSMPHLSGSVTEFDDLNALENIAHSMFSRKFEQMEKYALSLLINWIGSSAKQQDPRSAILSILLYDFNSWYRSWLEEKRLPWQKEISDLRSLEHDNLFLAYCKNVHAMEALLHLLVKKGSHGDTSNVLFYIDRYKDIYLM
jgi:hypothetical protein